MLRSLQHLIEKYDAKAPLSKAHTIPSEWYTEPRVFALEKRAVFGRSWQMVGRTSQVAEAGQYLTAKVGDEPVIVVRGTDGRLRGFFNVCRHHAAAVMTEPCGKANQLRCPYHGWTYGLDGALRSGPDWEGMEAFDVTENSLVPVSVETWESFVFVHLGRDPVPFNEFVGEMVSQVAPLNFGQLQFCERRTWEINCNWKVFVDNYLDGGYHVPFLHKGLNSILDYKAYSIENFGRVCLQKSPIDAMGGEVLTASVRTGQALYYWLYPNVMFNWYEGYLDTNLVIPLAVDRTAVVFDFYFADVGPATVERNRKSMDVSDRIQNEDHAICEAVQRGLASQAYGAGRLSVRREGGEHLFHRLLAADLTHGLRHEHGAD